MKYVLALSRLIAVVFVTSFFFTACFSRAVPVENAPPPWGDDKPEGPQMIDFSVDNAFTQNATIYVVRYPAQFRIGYVDALTQAKVRLRKSDLDGSGCVVIRVRLQITHQKWTSDRVCMRANQRLDLQINPLLAASSLTPWDKRK